jgi:hypothetical protein
METALSTLNEENLRTLVIVVAIAGAFIWQNTKLEKRFIDQDRKSDERFSDFEKNLSKSLDQRFDWFYQQLKLNDFAHLNNAISKLTFILEKNGFLKREDREHINSKLDK